LLCLWLVLINHSDSSPLIGLFVSFNWHVSTINPILESKVCLYAQSLSKFCTSQCAQNHQTPTATQTKKPNFFSDS
jgi:hypothetical protein